MQVTFVQKREDIRLARQWVRSPPLRRWVVTALLYVLIVLLSWSSSHDLLLSVCGASISLLVSLPLQAWSDRHKADRELNAMLADDPALVGFRTLAVSQDGLRWCGPTRETLFPWHDLKAARLQSRFLFLFMNDGRLVAVPLCAFAERSEAHLFQTTVKAFKTAADAGAPLPLIRDDHTWPPPPRALKP